MLGITTTVGKEEGECIKDSQIPVLCVIRCACLVNSVHVPEGAEGELSHLATIYEFMGHSKALKELNAFLKILPTGPGCLLKASMHLLTSVSEVYVPEETLKILLQNFVQKMTTRLRKLEKLIGGKGRPSLSSKVHSVWILKLVCSCYFPGHLNVTQN